jgi:hypothetical protein
MNPSIWKDQVENEYRVSVGEIPEYIKPNERNMPNIRRYVNSDAEAESLTFKNAMEIQPTYDAFEKDIAIVDFYFSKPTIVQFKRSESMTWINYISQIGGLLGLAMGFSIISAIEIVYWGTIRLCRNVISRNDGKKKVSPWATPRGRSMEEKYQKVASLTKQKTG